MREVREAPKAVPAAAREFSRAEQLLIRVPVYASAPTISATLISPAGQVMRQLAVEQAGPTATRAQIDLPLAALPPGLYSVQLAATAAGGNAKDTLAFRVTN
jgi:hypothetical protein